MVILGARQHNLKNLEVKIPREKLTVFSGVSGSGKSSLALDTIYAEGQRRYVESLSAYARQFLSQMPKPKVEHVSGLSPAIAIEQKAPSKNPRSTVGTVTEIYDFLRVLWARLGQPHCYRCGAEVSTQTSGQIVDRILSLPEKTHIYLLASVEPRDNEDYVAMLERFNREGYARARMDGEVIERRLSVARKSGKCFERVALDCPDCEHCEYEDPCSDEPLAKRVPVEHLTQIHVSTTPNSLTRE